MKNPQCLAEALSIMRIFTNFLTYNPVTYDVQSKVYKHSLKGCLKIIVISCIYLIYYLLAWQSTTEIPEQFKNLLFEATNWFEVNSLVFIQLTGSVIMCLFSKKLASNLNKTEEINKKLKTLGPGISFRRIYVFIAISSVLIFIDCLFVVVKDFLVGFHTKSRLYALADYLPFILTNAISQQFITFVILTEELLKASNDILKKILLKKRLYNQNCLNNITVVVRKVHEIYQNILEYSETVNLLYSFQLTCLMGCYFVTCINELHQIYTNSNIYCENVILKIIMNFQVAFIAFLKTVLIIWSCCRVYTQVDILIYIIHDMNNKSFNHSLNNQLRWFSMHLRDEKILYCPCQLFMLDIKFFGKVMVGIVSYLLILIQFDRAKEM